MYNIHTYIPTSTVVHTGPLPHTLSWSQTPKCTIREYFIDFLYCKHDDEAPPLPPLLPLPITPPPQVTCNSHVADRLKVLRRAREKKINLRISDEDDVSFCRLTN